MEHSQGTLKNGAEAIHPYEYEQASKSYLMAVVAVIAALPLPIVNVLASAGYYLAHRKSGYFVRWHSIQAILVQLIMLPFNSFLFWWTVSLLFSEERFPRRHGRHAIEGPVTFDEIFSSASLYYWLYLSIIVFLNIVEFFSVIYTAGRVGKGHNVRWFLISDITDALCSRKNRDPYKI
ncbi:hypothetical protein OGH69_02530 [Flavobacterium sp. MFBS3-15]|uniref:hypothetical protein n=1 Tax=Flavobacterium sp. MFBS3-15 TaxID=2989816 RepID=UPI002235FF63|nr:hypothetical protein [Flavobacterium sp. MFBS3-15]MCW4467827.1 hypothetical protein [Flavobacterium sp. MFBS3-15]